MLSASELRQLKKRVRELERLLGKKTMAVEILKEAIEIARTPLPLRGRHPVKRIAEALEVAPSRLTERLAHTPETVQPATARPG